MRGYFGIGIYKCLKNVNVETLWRSAYAMVASRIGGPAAWLDKLTAYLVSKRQLRDEIDEWRFLFDASQQMVKALFFLLDVEKRSQTERRHAEAQETSRGK